MGDVNGGEAKNTWSDGGCSEIRSNINIHESPLSPGTKLLAQLNLQGGDSSTSGESSPLGLKLTKTPSFIDLLQQKLHEAKAKPSHHNCQPESNDSAPPMESEKRKNKATNFPAQFLTIGSWTRKSIYEGDLVAKCYFAKKKLVWELLNGPLKSKIEIVWDDICAMRAYTHASRMGILEIELIKPPKFYQETAPQPRKHTNWEQCSDFTQGQALLWRRHRIEFSPGILDKHYENLIHCDSRLFEISQCLFPIQQTQFIYPTILHIGNDAVVCDPIQNPIPLHMQHQSSYVVSHTQQYQSSSIWSQMHYQSPSVLPSHLATDLSNTNSNSIAGGFTHNPNMVVPNEIRARRCLENEYLVQPYSAMVEQDNMMMSNLFPQSPCLGTNQVLVEMERHMMADSLLLCQTHTGLPNFDTTMCYRDPTIQPSIAVYDPQPLQSFPQSENSMQEIVVDDNVVDHEAVMCPGPVFW